MAVRNSRRELRTATPVELYWTFDEDDEVVPRLTVADGPLRERVLDEYDADSVEDLADSVNPNARALTEIRLGVVTGTGESPTFHREADLLERVEGISENLAAGLVEWCRDIPTLCERRRRNGDVFLGDLRHDAEVEDVDWLSELEEFIEDLDREDNLEARMKAAGVWVEPETEVADW